MIQGVKELSMLGWRQVTPGSADDTVWGQDGWKGREGRGMSG